MIKQEHERVKALWKSHDLSDEIYRRFTMYLLNLRSQGMDSTQRQLNCFDGSIADNTPASGGADEPPLVMIHSRPDDKHMVIWFRDYHLLVPHFHHKIMTLGTHFAVDTSFP